MRKGRSLFMLFVVFVFLPFTVNAALEVRGTDSLGNQLIYDSDFNITWYDYSWAPGTNPFTTYPGGATSLTVDFGGTSYSSWRSPRVFDLDAWGYYDTTSEMGHLYYTEFGNTPSSGLANKTPFLNLLPQSYWTGTTYTGTEYFYFNFSNGYQAESRVGNTKYMIVVRDGDVPQQPIAPEPISSILFVTGGTLLAGRRYLRKKKA